MDSNIRSRWYSHRNTQPDNKRITYNTDWAHFEEWTGNLVHDVGDQDTSTSEALKAATQLITQSP